MIEKERMRADFERKQAEFAKDPSKLVAYKKAHGIGENTIA